MHNEPCKDTSLPIVRLEPYLPLRRYHLRPLPADLPLAAFHLGDISLGDSGYPGDLPPGHSLRPASRSRGAVLQLI
jgi:hypothetical protein